MTKLYANIYLAIYMNSSILSTKFLTDAQQELVLNTGLSLTHYDVLKTKQVFCKKSTKYDHVIITSQNAIETALKNRSFINKISCVGETTAATLRNYGFQPTQISNSALELAQQIITKFPDDHFTYFCSDQRRHELPALFLKEKIPLEEIIVYRSIALMKSFDRIFAAVTFYSPRGVHAFAKANPKNKPLNAVCIGETTASTAKKYYQKVVVANKQTVENTLITAIKAIRND
ncbi:MAG: uroporphyrinogen-III synthase [Nonlabens sp.]|uniref:uroporphyrinogen-III synthase n=1 Tax=Nonlabens sp. TaxID=1888209 RepID=UPI00321C1BD0